MRKWIMRLLEVRQRKDEIDPREEASARFRQLLATANAIAAKNPRGLPDLVLAILRPFQSEALLAVAERGTDAIPNIHIESLFGKAVVNRFYADGYLRGKKIPPDAFKVHLGRHIVLPWPWNHGRYVDAVATIGAAKVDPASPWGRWQPGAWRQDPQNHVTTLWLPWGITTVGGGNHSIMAGILAGEGVIVPSAVYDMRCVLEDVHSDGLAWFETKSNHKIADVEDPRAASVFEIGRLMTKVGFPAFHDEAQHPAETEETQRDG